IDQTDRYTGVQEGEFAQAFCQNVVLEFSLAFEGVHARPETHACPGFIGFADNSQAILRFTMAVDLLVNFAVTADNQFQFLRQGVNNRDPD
ncbi:hypothetical protein Q0M89_14250, partial [Staphylococcus aureus]|nr:hypothetical protein [Staphylococcus aureus]